MVKHIFAVIEGWRTDLAEVPTLRSELPETVHVYRYGKFILINGTVTDSSKFNYQKTYDYINDIVKKNNESFAGAISAESTLRAFMLTPNEHGELNTDGMFLFRTWLIRTLLDSDYIVMKRSLKDPVVFNRTFDAPAEQKDPAVLLKIVDTINDSTIFNRMLVPGNYTYPVKDGDTNSIYDSTAPVFEFGYVDTVSLQFIDSITNVKIHRENGVRTSDPEDYWATYSI